eukprot:1157315-Pelagomonas_calceolata.AAC.2
MLVNVDACCWMREYNQFICCFAFMDESTREYVLTTLCAGLQRCARHLVSGLRQGDFLQRARCSRSWGDSNSCRALHFAHSPH